jgi:hypothetical protein
MSETSGFETVLKWAVIAIVAIVALKVVATVLGIAFVIGGFLLGRVLPLILVVWLGYRAVLWLREKEPAAGV